MIRRTIEARVRASLSEAPAVLLVGARQVGKTTLARAMKGIYFDLEKESDRLRLDLEWPDLVSQKRLVVLDEAQVWPEVFPRLRSAIDEDRGRRGRFLLLGSVAPSLMREVSESLAGRLSVVRLTPVTLGESSATPLDDFWLRGGFPEPLLMQSLYPRWHTSYLTLLAQRDLPEWGLPSKPAQTERLFKMLAALHGQPLNASQLGKSLGLSHNTVRGYIDFLEGAFLLRVIRTYAANIKKRLVKSPRIYWTDSGLLHALLGIEDRNHLLEQPWVGASWEGFVIQQVLGSLHARGNEGEAYFFRTSDGYEADLVMRLGRELWAIEVKLTSNPSTDDIRRLNRTADLIGAPKRALISRTPKPVGNGKTFSCNLGSFLEMVEKVA